MKSKPVTTSKPVKSPLPPLTREVHGRSLAREVYELSAQIERLQTARAVLMARLGDLQLPEGAVVLVDDRSPRGEAPAQPSVPPATPPKRVFSTAAKRRMSAGMVKFWAKRKAAAKAKQLARVGKTVSKALQKEHIAARRKVRLAAAKPAKMAKAAKPVPTTATGAEG